MGRELYPDMNRARLEALRAYLIVNEPEPASKRLYAQCPDEILASYAEEAPEGVWTVPLTAVPNQPRSWERLEEFRMKLRDALGAMNYNELADLEDGLGTLRQAALREGKRVRY
jgi:hypothetical protein